MMITREQEVACWRLIAKSYNLKDTGDNICVGTCPFCEVKNSFGININTNYAGCWICDFEGISLVSTIKSLINTSSSGVIPRPCFR